MSKITYIVYNTKTDEELIYEDLQHAQSELKHKAMHEGRDDLTTSNWSLISHICNEQW